MKIKINIYQYIYSRFKCFIENIYYFLTIGYWGYGHDYTACDCCANKIICKRCNKTWNINIGTLYMYNEHIVQCIYCKKMIPKQNIFGIINHACRKK